MTKEATVHKLLRQSSLDEETRDYVAALILGGEEEDLADTLGSFLCEDGDAAILSQLLEQASPPSTEQNKPEPLRRLEHAVTLTTAPPPPAVPPPPTITTEQSAKSQTKAASRATAPAAAPAAQLFGTNDYGSAQHAALDELDDLDDHSAKWEELKASGGKGIWSGSQKRVVHSWGGRGMGGRGVPKLYSANNPNVHLHDVTLHYKGKELLGEYSGPGTGNLGLVGSILDLQQGHCYGLIGRNGVGKSTLLKRIGRGSLPGFPMHLRTFYLQQEGLVQDGTVLEALLRSDDRLELMKAEVELWENLEPSELVEGDAAEKASYLGDLYEKLEEIESAAAEKQARAKRMLKELGFTAELSAARVADLSGGWRMRLSLAQCLFAAPDVLLLDEPTNHLDLRGVLWLQRQLQSDTYSKLITICVSHDRTFLEAVCSDVIVFADKKLTYHHTGYAAYLEGVEQTASRNASQAAAAGRQVDKQKAFIAKQRTAAASKKGVDDNKLRQAKEREKKLDRITYSHNGGKYRTSYGLPERIQQLKSHPTLRFNLPEPISLRGGSDLPALTMDSVTFRFPPRASMATSPDPAPVLTDLTLQVGLSTRVAIIGENGAGKTTLVNLISGALSPTVGEVHRLQGLRVAMVSQHQIERLRDHLDKSAVQFIVGELSSIGECVRQQDVLNHLGAFGLSGDLATQSIGMLSGGQKARLTLAQAMWDRPHIMILDEPTNHLDSDAMEALQVGIGSFKGGIIAISHSADFVASFCKELWILKNGRIAIHHTEILDDFEKAYSTYSNSILAEFE
mmetsp:Transcript_48509/g.96657  ORF Transcript_48509/g.96657 Transcript_48509/m.96657 type:complete len:794 (-) Transcript_48509:349-2730(-)|eukprot:CAMPEP_0174706138 /NCGR_PEP_ID=MMETSP1094-20130205/9092_1 /TAXON_ID=156173 /ORGANISM="Chrysochromulina brevifilum, Strain UTEX LB 985" /LENGTH=793 /DNA_ID=CAMNT_0015904367 /DNA_START=111 /DNA_END=2492 /DNA_ORIENTATION=+